MWGNQRVRGGQITAAANAWRQDVTWGDGKTGDGETIVWGTATDAAAPWTVVRDGGNDLGAEMDLEEEVTLAAWPEDLRDSAWAAGQPRTTVTARTSGARDVARRSVALAAPR